MPTRACIERERERERERVAIVVVGVVVVAVAVVVAVVVALQALRSSWPSRPSSWPSRSSRRRHGRRGRLRRCLTYSLYGASFWTSHDQVSTCPMGCSSECAETRRRFPASGTPNCFADPSRRESPNCPFSLRALRDAGGLDRNDHTAPHGETKGSRQKCPYSPSWRPKSGRCDYSPSHQNRPTIVQNPDGPL